jgi:hypothetical protein
LFGAGYPERSGVYQVVFSGCGVPGGVAGVLRKEQQVEVYFKKLTDDLLEVCRMLDDKPEIKNRLSEITAGVSFLPDVGYAFGKWTTTPPTKDGYYWVFSVNSKPWITNPIVERVERKNGEPNGELGVWHSGNWDEFHSVRDYTGCCWLGPIPAPHPPTEE